MSESKMLKAYCRKTNQYFGLEIKKYGSDWKVVNMIKLSDDESKIISSEIRQSSFYTNSNLLPCVKCGNRKISGCGCSVKNHACSQHMKYQFDCVYCSEFEIDYSRATYKGPYTKWAGTSNIPDAIKDKYGNPQGSQYDLAQDGSFVNYKIIVLNLCNECNFSEPRKALNKKGFEVIEYKTIPSAKELQRAISGNNTQLWVVSHKISYMNGEHLRIIRDYYESGHGVYIWGDNDPYYADANLLLESIFGLKMHGNSHGDKVLGIQEKNEMPGLIANHPITTGIMNFYEGITIAEVDTKPTATTSLKSLFGLQGSVSSTNQVLLPLIYGSNGLVVAAYYDSDNKRAIVDGGFTRLYYKWDSAGTDRYVVNAAAWLANIERFGYNN